MSVKILHNPRCSKSRQTLELLKDRGCVPEVIEYLKNPLDRTTLESILAKLGLSPRDILRKGEKIYQEMELANPDLPDEALITAMLENPILIERPIVITDKAARIGRPPESVLEIL
ncbi:arsenate reductase (glutaredoxin) [Kiloniella laminariae]|uniref:Arsenate reductase n=1 Tax=Kiloniella laminariae TaxID=454162 RepID=A0ABT4LM76_9PROT|nr:arsenate reductase (glutaredoxin) [Kiloniella laminariae]MCZ4282208.1 arsenate reductase (glutaredoxin) [Kiloniella laminariae]